MASFSDAGARKGELTRRLGTACIATLNERHFRAVRPLTGEAAFVLLPADA